MKRSALSMVLWGFVVGCGDNGSGAGGADAAVDSRLDASADAAPDAAPLPASCKQILASHASAPSGNYMLADPASGTVYMTYCDMTTNGGGWTRVSNALPAAIVDGLRGASGREMLKCTDTGIQYIISPAFSASWSWADTTFHQLGGTWTVNGGQQSCGTDPEFTNVICSTWWGFGCGNGPGPNNKLFPGVLDMPTAGFCADASSAHTNGAFVICGVTNYRNYSVFIRAD